MVSLTFIWIIKGRRGSSSVHAYQGTWWRTRVSFGTTGNVTINSIKGLRGLEQNVITHHTWWEKWVLRVYACVHRCNTVTKSRNIVRKIFDSQNIDFIPVKIIALTTSMFLFCNVVLWKTFFLVFYQKYWPALNLPDYFDISAIQVISSTFGNCIAFYTDNRIPQNVNENKRSNFKLIFEDEDNPMYRTHSVPYLWN